VNDDGAARLAASDRSTQRPDGEVAGHPVAAGVADDRLENTSLIAQQ
jgi:hypothetical protein